MKKVKNLLFSITGIFSTLAISTLSLTSCNNDKTKLEHQALSNNPNYINGEIEVGDIYVGEDFTFSFTLNTDCYIDLTESYIKVMGHHSHSFTSQLITTKLDGSKYTCTVNKNIVQEGYVLIYISAFKLVGLDTTTSSSDFEVISGLTSYPIENKEFTLGFKVLNDKALDLSKTVIKVGENTISTDYLYIYDTIYDSALYSFITIPSSLVTGNISISLQSSEAANVTITNYPEYKTSNLTKACKNSDYYIYFNIANSDSYQLDTDNAIIKVGDTKLESTKYSFGKYLTIPYLKIIGENVTDDISVDVPVIEIFTLYANSLFEYPTVEVEGEKIVKGKEYQFTVKALNDKTIEWDNSASYILVNDTKLVKDTGFTYTYDSEKKIYTVTVPAEYTMGDMFCHFVTK